MPIVRARQSPDHLRMATPISLLLEIEPAEDSMTGRISTNEGESRQFVGWLGLVNTLQALIGEPRPQADPLTERP